MSLKMCSNAIEEDHTLLGTFAKLQQDSSISSDTLINQDTPIFSDHDIQFYIKKNNAMIP